jgi:phosphate/sulfate permease
MNKFFKKHLLLGIFIIAGLAAGFIYWRFIGCKSGTCPITSSWHYSMLFGGVFGYLIGDSVKDYKKKKKSDK